MHFVHNLFNYVFFFYVYILMNNKDDKCLGNNIDKVIKIIFSGYPKSPCTYSISLSNELIEKNISPFQLLMKILVDGARLLYGESITPNEISEEQFKMLKMYIESIGYSIKYNYTFPELEKELNIEFTEKPKVINIWFEKYRNNIDCHGRILV
jgi:hypothetical protein